MAGFLFAATDLTGGLDRCFGLGLAEGLVAAFAVTFAMGIGAGFAAGLRGAGTTGLGAPSFNRTGLSPQISSSW